MNITDLKSIIESPSGWSTQDEAALLKPYTHIAAIPGKKFRNKLITLFNTYYHLPDESIAILLQIIEILHNSSLLIDDIEDNSESRRGIKSAHVVFGLPMTINTANYMYFKAMSLLDLLPPVQLFKQHNVSSIELLELRAQLTKIFVDEMLNLHRGQGLDIYWRDNGIVPTEKMYFEMVSNKTGGLFRLAARLMEALASVLYKNALIKKPLLQSITPLCTLLGILYQIRDDYLNLCDDTLIKNKGFGDDITEGKLSFPIIHGIRYEEAHRTEDSPCSSFIRDTLNLRTRDLELKRRFIRYLETESKSFTYTRLTLQNLVNLIRKGDYIPALEGENDKGLLAEFNKVLAYISAV